MEATNNETAVARFAGCDLNVAPFLGSLRSTPGFMLSPRFAG